MTLLRLPIRLTLAAALLAGASALLVSPQAAAPDRAWITVLSTTDLHGNILPVDYYADRPDARGLAKVATLVRQVRRENPGGTLLVDSGDTIQGTPLAYMHNRRNNTPPDPMMLAMSTLGFDAMAVGNHEYNFGLTVLEKARGEARFPWLSANTYRRGSSEGPYLPYVVKEVQGVRVGILGLTTPGIPAWENPENYAGLEFKDPVAEAARRVAYLRDQERVDLVVVAAHTGVEEDLPTGEPFPAQVAQENTALALARQVPGIDVLLMGHTHRDVQSLTVNGVSMLQADSWGRRLGRADVVLTRGANGRWTKASTQLRLMPVTDATVPDPEIVKLAEPYDRETRDWLSRPIGESAEELSAQDGYFNDTAILDLIHRVQMDVGKADVSMVANFNTRARLPKGRVTVRDIAGLYIYENTLVVLEVTGRQLKEALEHSAKFFGPHATGQTPAQQIDNRIPGFNFDIAEGVTYDLDITKPVGERVQNLRLRGQPLDPARTLRLATNNYRVNGGGGYTMYAGAKEVYRSSDEIRELIIAWIEKNPQVPTTPTENWRLVSDAPAVR